MEMYMWRCRCTSYFVGEGGCRPKSESHVTCVPARRVHVDSDGFRRIHIGNTDE